MMEKLIKDYLSQQGKKGGSATSAKYGKEHYRKLAENMNRKKAEKNKNPE